MHMHRTAYLLLLLTSIFWGGNAIAGKLAVGHVSPMLLTAARWGFAAIILCVIGWRQLGADWVLVRREFIAPALLVVYTTAINVSIEQAGIPMLIFLANFLLFRLRVTWAQILGAILSLAGVAPAGILPDAQGWGVIAYTVLFPSILAQIFYIRGVELIGANRAGLFINLVPIVGTLLSIIMLGEAFFPYHAIAMALVLGGIWLAETSGRKLADGRGQIR